MNAVAQIFAGFAVLVHLLAFTWEVVLFERPGVHEGIFRIPPANLPATRLWSFMLLAGIALGVSDLLALSRPRGAGRGGALAQALPPLGALVAALF